MPKNNTPVVPRKQAHRYTNIREAVVIDASATVPQTYDLITGPDGSGYYTVVLSSKGVSSVRGAQTGTTAGSSISWVYQTNYTPTMSWLTSTSSNFEMYRVTRATLVVVGNLGSTATGKLAVMSTPDCGDYSAIGTPTFSSVASCGKVVEVAQLASKDLRVPLDIDSSWKKVSGLTAFISSDNLSITPMNTLNDLAFTKVVWRATGAAANISIATFTIEYDVEFKHPTFGQNY